MIYFTELAVASLPLKAKTCTFRSCVNPSQHAAASYPLVVRERLRFEPEDGLAGWRDVAGELPEQGA